MLKTLRSDAQVVAVWLTAALFLQRFRPAVGAWVHFDIFAWCARARPGFAAGGEVQAIHALFEVLKTRYP